MIEKLVWMKGKVFSTLTQNKRFTIIDVTENKIVIRIENGNIRPIFRKNIEECWARLVRDKKMTQSKFLIRGTQNSAYITAILSNTFGVTSHIKPARLEYRPVDD